MRALGLFAMLTASLLLAACADFVERRSIVTGENETLSIATEPAGASCRVLRGHDLLGSVTTPGRLDVTTSGQDIVITCSKPDYEVAALLLPAEPDQAPGYLGALAGWAIDAVDWPHWVYAPETNLPLIASGAVDDSGGTASAGPPRNLTPPGANPEVRPAAPAQ